MVLPSIDERGAAADPGPGRRTRGGYAILRGKSRARTHMQAEVPRWGGKFYGGEGKRVWRPERSLADASGCLVIKAGKALFGVKL